MNKVKDGFEDNLLAIGGIHTNLTGDNLVGDLVMRLRKLEDDISSCNTQLTHTSLPQIKAMAPSLVGS